MEWAIAVVAAAVLGVGAVVATGRMGAMKEEPVRDHYRQELPATPLVRADVDGLRFGTVLRGYSMGQVDHVLQRLGREIADRDTRLAELEERLGGDPAVTSRPDWPAPAPAAGPSPEEPR